MGCWCQKLGVVQTQRLTMPPLSSEDCVVFTRCIEVQSCWVWSSFLVWVSGTFGLGGQEMRFCVAIVGFSRCIGVRSCADFASVCDPARILPYFFSRSSGPRGLVAQRSTHLVRRGLCIWCYTVPCERSCAGVCQISLLSAHWFYRT